MKRISLLCLMLFLVACGSETDTSLGMLNQPPSLTIKEQTAYRYQVSLQNASQDAVITINNLPAWAEFDAEENVISGTPEHTDADQEYTYSISVEDGGELFQSDDVTIRVEHSTVTIMPMLQSRTSVNELSSFKRTIDVESDIQPLTFSLINAPEWVEINELTGVIFGRIAHKDMGELHDDIQYLDIKVSVTDGFHSDVSEPFVINAFALRDVSPILGVVDTNLDSDYRFNQDITITFDQTIDVTTISLDAPTGECISNILISSDDFSTCIQPIANYDEPQYNYPDNDPELSDEENQEIRDAETERAEKEARESNQLVLSGENLEVNTNYKLLITSHAAEGFEYSLEVDFEQPFFTLQ